MKIQKNDYFIEYLDVYNGKISKYYELPFLDEIKKNLTDNLNSRILKNQYELKQTILESKKLYKMKFGLKQKEKFNISIPK